MGEVNELKSGNHEYFIDHVFLATEHALWDIDKDIQIKDHRGKIENVVLTTDARYLYFRLTKALNWKEPESGVTWGLRHFAKKLGWSVNTLQKNIDLLEQVGLIDIQREGTKRSTYLINSLYRSNILYDREDENGEYVHKEIEYYIKAMKDKENDILKGVDKFHRIILEVFDVYDPNKLSQDQKRKLKHILDKTDKLSQPDLWKLALTKKMQKNDIDQFLDYCSSQMNGQYQPGQLLSIAEFAEIL